MKKLREKNGITLIALIITIIVLLILAGVAIGMLTGENGILKNAKLSEEQTKAATIEEIRDLWISEMTMAGIVKEQEKKSLNNLLDEMLNQKLLTEEEIKTIKEKGEITIADKTIVFEKVVPKTVKEILKEGDNVIYVDANGIERECAVLYGPENENYESYGIQLVTLDIVEDVTLGSTVVEEAKISYNGAISTLNAKAETYRNKEMSDMARVIGTLPNDPSSESGNYTDNPFPYISGMGYNGELKDGDTNSELDVAQLNALNIYRTKNKENYWFGSRKRTSKEEFSQYWSEFDIKYMNASDFAMVSMGDAICYAYYITVTGSSLTPTATTGSNQYTRGLRPVFSLNDDIKVVSGNGDDVPYVLSK